MKYQVLSFTIILLFFQSIFPQTRINYNNQNLFLNGANLAWVSFAQDVGPDETDFNTIANTLLAFHDNGGNSARLWIHTNGTTSPEFNSENYVIGPGDSTVNDIRKILDIAWKREIGMKLCLWSFDMLRTNNGNVVNDRNRLLLEDTSYTMAYINNVLIPLVDSLKGHPGILAWEIFNEPEGMSNEFGWSNIQHTAMANIQRFINLCAGAIHRHDPSALVTSGAWSFAALSDVSSKGRTPGTELFNFSMEEKEEIQNMFMRKYGLSLTAEEIIAHIQKVTAANVNYYRDDRLIAAGGDPLGILDFYSVHFYSALGSGLSPFTHSASYWNLNKPVVVAEFAIQESHGGLPKNEMYKRLYLSGYAGALAWSWTDTTISTNINILANMKSMRQNYQNDVDVDGISGDWPLVSIISPADSSEFPDNTETTITAEASDPDGEIILVEFFTDTVKIGEKSGVPYTITWQNIEAGNYKLTAIATDNIGNQRRSAIVNIKAGTPAFINLEAEAASRSGSNIIVRSNPAASGGNYVELRTNTGSITWQISNVSSAGTYEVRFGYRLSFDTPKTQFLNVNGVRVDEIVFNTPMNLWLEKPVMIDLQQGNNLVQMELSWGWMDIDYLSVPTGIVTDVADKDIAVYSYGLDQNYPNPFNPVTNLRYSVEEHGFVILKIYDILGREVITLVNEEKSPGEYTIIYNAINLASGVYYYQLNAGDFISTKKMVLLK